MSTPDSLCAGPQCCVGGKGWSSRALYLRRFHSRTCSFMRSPAISVFQRGSHMSQTQTVVFTSESPSPRSIRGAPRRKWKRYTHERIFWNTSTFHASVHLAFSWSLGFRRPNLVLCELHLASATQLVFVWTHPMAPRQSSFTELPFIPLSPPSRLPCLPLAHETCPLLVSFNFLPFFFRPLYEFFF